MKKGFLHFGIFAIGITCSLTILAQSSDKNQNPSASNTLTLESIFKDPGLYPKPGNFGEFSPDGKHFIELKIDEQPSDKQTSNAPQKWTLVKKDIEGKSNTPIVLFDAGWFKPIPPQAMRNLWWSNSKPNKFTVIHLPPSAM
jgi:hypothetical protein